MINFRIPPKDRPTIVAVQALLKRLDVLCEAARVYAIEAEEEDILSEIEEMCTDFEKKIQDYFDTPDPDERDDRPTIYEMNPVRGGRLI